ncbi:MAG: hypothetical protein EX285_08585 [Thaumarchaeota archaeon]|nr:hypothetical protein [Nitrososphaerota archaeon]
MYPISKIWYATAKLGYDVQKYNYSETNKGNLEGSNATTVSYEAVNRGINLSTSIRYMKDNYLIKPFLEVGLIGRSNFSNVLYNYTNDNLQEPNTELQAEYKVNKYRRAFNLGFDLQGGAMIKAGENFVEVGLGATYYIIPEVNYKGSDKGRYGNSVAGKHVVYEDNYTKWIINLTVKFNMPFYNFR